MMMKSTYIIPDVALDRFKKLRKDKKNIPPDSLAAEIFYMYRFFYFFDFYTYYSINWVKENVSKMRTWEVDGYKFITRFKEFLRLIDLRNKVVFVTSYTGPKLREIMGVNDIGTLITVDQGKPILFSMENMFSTPGYVPWRYENIKQAITLAAEGRNAIKPADYGVMDIPGSTALQNSRQEKIVASVDPAASALIVTRTTTLKGQYKADVQKDLILVEEFCNSEQKDFGSSKTILQELESGDKDAREYARVLKTAFDEQRKLQKDAFIVEAKSWFESDVTDMADFKTDSLGIRHTQPNFVYSSKFKMGDIVKKAGNNLIVEIGKLQGSPLKITSEQRNRKLDIYMPFARSIQSQIVLQIPAGYTAEGIETLNTKVENEAGYFISEALSDGRQITIILRKSYNHSFEPVANWDKLLAFIDAADEWANSKILLKKNP